MLRLLNYESLTFTSVIIIIIFCVNANGFFNSTIYKSTLKDAQPLQAENPTVLRVLAYTVNILTIIEEPNFEYSGTVTITIAPKVDIHEIYFFSTVKNVTFCEVAKPKKKYRISCRQDAVRGIIRLEFFPHLTIEKNYEIIIKFKNELTDLGYGYYTDTYHNHNNPNKTHYYTLTQMKPYNARRVFPCLDRPEAEHKAKFTIELTHHKSYFAVTNMGLESSKHYSDTYVTDTFITSTPMSTYLIAFSINKFVKYTHGNVTIWSRPDVSTLMHFAAEGACNIINTFEKEFEIPFPLAKLDILAIPRDEFETVNNWGLIYIREDLLIFSDDRIFNTQIEILKVLAFEIVQQFYMQIMLPDFLSCLFINDGFAALLQYIILDLMLPEEQILYRFNIEIMYPNFLRDIYPDSISLNECITPKNDFILSEYKRKVFGKSAIIMKMFTNIILLEKFKDAFYELLNDYGSYGAINHTTILDAVLKYSLTHNLHVPNPIPVLYRFEYWAVTSGYPLITMSRNTTSNRVILDQRRFYYNRDIEPKQTWWTPISYVTLDRMNFDETAPKLWLTNTHNKTFTKIVVNTTDDCDEEDDCDDQFIILNVQQTGYYRINYDDTNWNAIIKYLTKNKGAFHKNIHVANRVQLIEDAFTLAYANLLKFSIPLNLTKVLQYDFNYLPWLVVSRHILWLDQIFLTDIYYEDFKEYFSNLIDSVYTHLGNEAISGKGIQEHHQNIMQLACNFDNVMCIRSCEALYKIVKSGNLIFKFVKNANIKVIYCTLIRNNGPEKWYEIHSLLSKVTTKKDQQFIIYGLTCSTVPYILETLLYNTINKLHGFQNADMHDVFKNVADNPIGYHVIKKFFYKYAEQIKREWPPYLLDEYLNLPLKRVYYDFQLQDYNILLDIFQKELLIGVTVMDAKIDTNENLSMMKNNLPIAIDWLHLNRKFKGTTITYPLW